MLVKKVSPKQSFTFTVFWVGKSGRRCFWRH